MSYKNLPFGVPTSFLCKVAKEHHTFELNLCLGCGAWYDV